MLYFVNITQRRKIYFTKIVKYKIEFQGFRYLIETTSMKDSEKNMVIEYWVKTMGWQNEFTINKPKSLFACWRKIYKLGITEEEKN